MPTSVEMVGFDVFAEKSRRTASGFMWARRATSAFDRSSSIRRSSSDRIRESIASIVVRASARASAYSASVSRLLK